MESFNLDKVE